MKNIMVAICAFLLLAGCITPMLPKAEWYYYTVTPDHIENHHVSLTIGQVASTAGMSLIILNKTDGVISVLWDRTVLVTPNGRSQRVIHSGTKLVDRSGIQAPSVIAPNGRIDDIIVPSDNVYYESGQYSRYGSVPGGWRYQTLWQESMVDGKAESLVGKQAKLVFSYDAGSGPATLVVDLQVEKVEKMEL